MKHGEILYTHLCKAIPIETAYSLFTACCQQRIRYGQPAKLMMQVQYIYLKSNKLIS